jgi:flagellar motor switch/type III secretory pathway protein FliN
MAGFSSDDVINHLRALKLSYIENNVGSDPEALPNHFSEFLGYATLLYDHYAEYIKQYEIKEAEITKEENARREQNNETAENRSDMVTVTEVEQRINVRIGELKGERKRLEAAVKGATLHINGCQSLMKNWSDESKGIR